VYDELLRKCHSTIESTCQSDAQPSVADPDDVYYRFGGAAIASMLHSRYAQIKVGSLNAKHKLSIEISVLQKISVHKQEDKSDVPAYLKYRDNGFMYFPCIELIPFLKAVDISTKDNCNDANFRNHGSELLKTLPDSVVKNSTLRSLFLTIVVNKVTELKDANLASFDSLFQELTCKVSHTRVQEYLDCFKQRTAASKGSGTLAGQNLRDSLLSNHVNLKSKIQ